MNNKLNSLKADLRLAVTFIAISLIIVAFGVFDVVTGPTRYNSVMHTGVFELKHSTYLDSIVRSAELHDSLSINGVGSTDYAEYRSLAKMREDAESLAKENTIGYDAVGYSIFKINAELAQEVNTLSQNAIRGTIDTEAIHAKCDALNKSLMIHNALYTYLGFACIAVGLALYFYGVSLYHKCSKKITREELNIIFKKKMRRLRDEAAASKGKVVA